MLAMAVHIGLHMHGVCLEPRVLAMTVAFGVNSLGCEDRR